MKDDFTVTHDEQLQNEHAFKARPLNQKIFESQAKLPSVERKEKTTFEEFHLSGSNATLAKKTLVEYV